MKKVFLNAALILAALSISTIDVQARPYNYKQQQKVQIAKIKRAYQSGVITPTEYRKLMEEQRIIKETIVKAKRNRYISPSEDLRIRQKLNRADDRLVRYKNNREVY